MKIETFRKKFKYFTSDHFRKEGFSLDVSYKLTWMVCPTLRLEVRGAGQLKDIWFHTLGDGKRDALVSYFVDGGALRLEMLRNVKLKGYK